MWTDDEVLARDNIWSGVVKELRQRMASFTVDGRRFGELLPETRSGSRNDRRLTKRSEEVVTAAFLLGRLGYERVKLCTRTENGSDLERPDLDAIFSDAVRIGVEVAQVGTTARMKGDAQIAELERSIRDLIDSDETFAEAFGRYYLSISPTSIVMERAAMSKKELAMIAVEITEFVRSGAHRGKDVDQEDHGYFDSRWPHLHARGASYFADELRDGPYFVITDGGTVNPSPETGEVVRVLDAHRNQAASYRHGPCWILMYLADTNEVFRNTVSAIAASRPDIAPFQQLHIADSVGRVASIGGTSTS